MWLQSHFYKENEQWLAKAKRNAVRSLAGKAVAKTYRSTLELTSGARAACEAHIAECKKQGLDIFITETYRSQERQNELYAQGRTKQGKKVTWTKTSNHTGRQAWDVSFKSTGYNDISKFNKAGKIAKALGITWGGEWQIPDRPHFEYKKDKFMADKDIDTLIDKLYWKGLITDKDLWRKYITGEEVLKASNLKAFCEKVVSK